MEAEFLMGVKYKNACVNDALSLITCHMLKIPLGSKLIWSTSFIAQLFLGCTKFSNLNLCMLYSRFVQAKLSVALCPFSLFGKNGLKILM